ncbi:tRNA uridine(34) 5-carboxymethylaminomethyl modification radical SAM/GNAT enzyme Elp3 [Candidatus Woesearchaeota archaeon]|nr:MAG: tRNA uridine(34) 5-carboxymethylaminomethyl modification radical SAM/GNAT enzyme Elp3 [Candidatus Woesearchaeota archaeon]
MEKVCKAIIKEIIENNLDIDKARRKFCREYNPKFFPSYIQILTYANNEEYKKLKHVKTKPTRTLSGVTPIAIMTKPMKCPHGKCTICPGGIGSVFGDIPQSYTGKEPATMRAIRNNYDPYLQVFNRLEQYILLNQTIEKVELIIMGGTFLAADKKYQEEFVAYALKAMNDFGEMFFMKEFDFVKFKKFFELPAKLNDKQREDKVKQKILNLKGVAKLEKEKKRNEKSFVRCVAMAIETRPDYGMLEHGNEALKLGCTRIEVGVQSVFNDVLDKINRGHSVTDTVKSIQILKDLGFKLTFHYMIGLPGSNPEKDYEGLTKLFSDERFKPDMLKIYPCSVMPGTKLYDEWKQGKYKELDKEETIKMLAKFKHNVPRYCRISRLMRDIPTKVTSAGVGLTNLRQEVLKYMAEHGMKCNCIRCSEVGHRSVENLNPKLHVIEYNASQGKEFFIYYGDENVIIGYCRLRLPYQFLRKEITEHSAIVRELHVYGEALRLNEKNDDSYQHKGVGKMLMKKAEEIALKNNKKKVLVISGIGVKEYYRKLGYKDDGVYVSKTFS